MQRFLLVDDDPAAEARLRGVLRQSADWDMVCVRSGAVALATLADQPFAAVVVDLAVLGADALDFLQTAHDRFPGVVRMVMSSLDDATAVLRAVPVSHQFLAKSIAPARVLQALDRAVSLGAMLNGTALARVVGAVGALPSVPGIYRELNRVLSRYDSSIDEVAEVVEQDPAMTAKILQLVNSSYFGLQSSVVSIKQAVSFLGTNVLRTLALSVAVFRDAERYECAAGFSIDAEREMAGRTARIAARLVARPLADEAFTAGMLHDIGKVILATQLPESYSDILSTARSAGRPVQEVERERLGASHAEVGGYLLGIWGMPYPIVEGVAYHHTPQRAGNLFDIVGAVHVASALADAAPGDSDLDLDVDFVAEAGIVDRIEEWRQLFPMVGA